MLENKIIKLIAIYARVSTGRQENEETVKGQLMVTRDLAKKNGYTIVKEYIDDGWSGDILARPALDQLRSDAKNKIWEAVLVYDPDRLARRYSYQELVMDEVSEQKIEWMFITVASPKNGEEKLMHGFRGLFAEYERMKIAERFRLGKQRKVREGHLLVSEAPYGYTYIPKKDKVHGYYEINEREAKVVKMIFSWVVNEKLTIRSVVRRLQELKIPPRESKRGVWNTSTLSSLLRNKTYIGEAYYGKSYAVVPERPFKNEVYKKNKKTSRKSRPEEECVMIPVPEAAIIDRELFERAGKQLADNYATCPRNRKNDYLLAGKIYCTCGRRRVGEGPQRGKHLYYRCTDRVYNFPLPRQCQEAGINARVADVKVWERMAGLMSSPDLMMEQAKGLAGDQHKESEVSQVSISGLKKEIEKLKKEDERYVKAYGAEVITLGQLQEHTNDIKGKIGALEGQISQSNQQKGQSRNMILPTMEELVLFCQEMQEMLKCLGFERKQKIIRDVVDRVTGNREKLLVSGYLPITLSHYYAFRTNDRDRGPAECREVHDVPGDNKKTS